MKMYRKGLATELWHIVDQGTEDKSKKVELSPVFRCLGIGSTVKPDF